MGGMSLPGKTFSQRLKETAAEYRYMPEPDIPPLQIDLVDGWDNESLRATIPELPLERRERYIAMGLPDGQADLLVKHHLFTDLFDRVTAAVSHPNAFRLTANYLLSDIMQYTEAYGDDLFIRLTDTVLIELITLIADGSLSSRAAKDILAVIVAEGGSPKAIAQERNLFQQSDEAALEQHITTVIEKHASVVAEYRGGKRESLEFLVGQVMKETHGTANPTVARELLIRNISG